MNPVPQKDPVKLPTRNVHLLTKLVSGIVRRPDPDLPGMGVFHGPSGYGKSMAVCAAAVPHKAYYVQMRSIWSRRYLLEMILERMSIQPAKTMPRMLTQIGAQLAGSGRPLIIDEADILVSKGMIEMARDIYESSQGTVILVGEENLPGMLEAEARVHGRMMDWVAAEPTGLEDARLFAGHHCQGIAIAEDLLERVVEAARGSARYVCTNLAKIAEFARVNNLTSLDAASYTEKLFTGQAPKRRRI